MKLVAVPGLASLLGLVFIRFGWSPLGLLFLLRMGFQMRLVVVLGLVNMQRKVFLLGICLTVDAGFSLHNGLSYMFPFLISLVHHAEN
jgi:hypothetical protein